MIDSNNIDQLTGAKMVDQDGDRIGTVDQVYVDNETGKPLFATVSTGLFGTTQAFVPLASADFAEGTLHVGYEKNKIKGAPHVADDGALNTTEQDRIFEYYGLQAAGSQSADIDGDRAQSQDLDDSADTGSQTPNDFSTADEQAPTDAEAGAAERSQIDQTVSGEPSTMTRSEERLQVDTERVPTERIQLRKHIVTEQQTITVPVSHEEVRLERVPITDENRDSALGGADLTEDEQSITLTAERPVISKETVPVEQVHVAKENVTEQQQVTEDVRHEEFDLVGAGQDNTR